MSKSPPTRALQSLIPVDCPAPPSWGKPLIGALKQVYPLPPARAAGDLPKEWDFPWITCAFRLLQLSAQILDLLKNCLGFLFMLLVKFDFRFTKKISPRLTLNLLCLLGLGDTGIENQPRLNQN